MSSSLANKQVRLCRFSLFPSKPYFAEYCQLYLPYIALDNAHKCCQSCAVIHAERTLKDYTLLSPEADGLRCMEADCDQSILLGTQLLALTTSWELCQLHLTSFLRRFASLPFCRSRCGTAEEDRRGQGSRREQVREPFGTLAPPSSLDCNQRPMWTFLSPVPRTVPTPIAKCMTISA